jgi:hypothetical protein
LLLCLLAVLLSSSVFAADTESGLCDLTSHNDYQLIADGTPVDVNGKRVYPGTQTLSLTCDNPAAGENLLLVQTDEGVPLEENLVYIDQKTGSADFEIYPSSLADGVTYYVYVSNDTGKTLAGTFSYYDPFPYTVTGAYAASKKNKGKYTFTVEPIEGAQYRMDDGAWQDSNVFDGIELDTEHVFYVQVDGRVGQSEPFLCRDAAKEAAKVDAIIKKLPAAKKVKLENETAIRDAKNIYDALPEDSKALVTPSNVTKLEDCIAALEQVKRENEELLKATAEARTLMEQLPEDTSYVDADHAQIVNDARTAYDKLDKAGKNSLKTEYKRLAACEKTLKKNEKAVQKVQTLLAKLPAAEDVMTKLSLTDKKNVTAAEKAYNPLTEDQRTFLTEDEHAKMQANSERMQTLIEGETLIKAAEKAIKSLPADTKIKATDSKKLETAQEAYDKVKNSEDGLTIDPKLAEKFETSRTAYYAYQQQAEDFRSEYLDALPENANAVTAEYETAIPAAQTAYKALSKNVQSFIEKAEVSHLKACEKTLKKNQSAAGKVDKLIAKLPADVSAEFTAKDEKAINAAWKAYSKLTSEQKTFLEDEQRLLDCYNKAYPEG